MRPYFSIITVVLNDLSGLKLTKESLTCQDFSHFEWIVIDGQSTDGTIDYLKKLPANVSRWTSEKDEGIYDAMNKGLKLCTGAYVLFLNAGDCFSDATVLGEACKYLSSLEQSPDVLFSGGTYVFSNKIRWYREPKQVEAYIWHGLPALHQATFYRRQLVETYQYDLTYQFCGDYYLACKLFVQGIKAAYIDLSVVDFSVGGVSFYSPIRLSVEAFAVQKNILKSSLAKRCRSLLKRILSLMGYYFLSLQGFHRRKDQIDRHRQDYCHIVAIVHGFLCFSHRNRLFHR